MMDDLSGPGPDSETSGMSETEGQDRAVSDAAPCDVHPGDAQASDTPVDDAKATDGRTPGRRGQATRQRLLDCTKTMLERGGYRELKIVDIAREAGTSPATFYQYFTDVQDAIAVLAQDMANDGSLRLPTMVRAHDWSSESSFESTASVVRGFFDFWEEHRPLMRVIDLTSAEGDKRIRPMRMALMSEFAAALAEVVAASIDSGAQPDTTDPMAVSSIVVTLLVNVAIQRYQFEFYKISSANIDDAVVRMVHTALTGRNVSSN